MRSSGARRGGQDSASDREGGIEELVPGRFREMASDLRRRTEESPGRTIAMAVGAGYLLGGGLFSPLTARLFATGLRVGLRVALLPFVTQSLLSMVEGTGARSSARVDDVGSEGSVETKAGGHARGQNSNQGRQTENKETHS